MLMYLEQRQEFDYTIYEKKHWVVKRNYQNILRGLNIGINNYFNTFAIITTGLRCSPLHKF